MITDQSGFRTALLDPAGLRPEGLVDGFGRPAGRRFDVYRNNVAVSLMEALETAFPVLRKLLGDINFRILAGVFLREHPPSSPVMMFYGAEMPGFLRKFQPTACMGYLPDVARLELALRESYHAAEKEGIAPQELQKMAPEDLMSSKIDLSPALRLVRSEWPIHAIWKYNTAPNTPKPQMIPQDVLVLRPHLDPELHLLSLGGGTFVNALQDGQSFGDAHELALSETSEFDLAETLALLVGADAITKIGA